MVEFLMLTNSQEVKGLPNIKSAIKRVKISKVKTLKNNIKKSILRTSIKKCKEAIAGKDTAAAEVVLKKAAKTIDKAAAKNIIHKNTAARKKSRLAKALNAANAVNK